MVNGQFIFLGILVKIVFLVNHITSFFCFSLGFLRTSDHPELLDNYIFRFSKRLLFAFFVAIIVLIKAVVIARLVITNMVFCIKSCRKIKILYLYLLGTPKSAAIAVQVALQLGSGGGNFLPDILSGYLNEIEVDFLILHHKQVKNFLLGNLNTFTDNQLYSVSH